MAVNEVVVAEGSLRLNSMHWITVMKMVLHILDFVNSDPDVDAFVSSSVKDMDVNGRTHIVIIALDGLKLVVLVQGRRCGGQLRGFSGSIRVIA